MLCPPGVAGDVIPIGVRGCQVRHIAQAQGANVFHGQLQVPGGYPGAAMTAAYRASPLPQSLLNPEVAALQTSASRSAAT
jgi:hypothetical protein